MRLVNISGATSVQHPEHGPAEAGPDGVFELPAPFAEALLEQAGQWRTEAEHIAAAARRRLEELADPKRAAEVLDFVHGRVAVLEEALAASREEVAALRAELDERVSALEDAAAQPPAKSGKGGKAATEQQ